MEWSSIISVIVAAVAAIGLPLALKKRKKDSPQLVEQLLHHLHEIGVKVSLVEDGTEAQAGVRRSRAERAEGVIKLQGSQVDYIRVTSVTSQYGVKYFLDYLVVSPEYASRSQRRKTKLVRKKASGFRGKVVDIEWKGDDYLSQALNLDYRLKDKLLTDELDELRSGIWIIPEPKHEHVRVRTYYLLPSPGSLQAVEIIARHIKSGW